MTTDAGVPASATPMVDGQAQTTSWDVALDRLQHPVALGVPVPMFHSRSTASTIDKGRPWRNRR